MEKEYDLAGAAFDVADSLVRDLGFDNMHCMILRYQAWVAEAQGHFEDAYRYLEMHMQKADSLEQKRNVADMPVRYLSISILLKQICERLDASTKALDRAAGRIVYLENFQPQGIPGEISDVTGRPKDRYTRGYYTSNPRAKLLAALAMIPDLPWEKCNV